MWTIAKYGLFLINLIFTLAGLALTGVSVVATLQLGVALDLAPRVFGAIPRIVIILGLLTFFIAFFGCWIRENKYYLVLYAISMLVLAASKIYLAVIMFGNLQIIDELMADWLGAAFNDNNLREKFHDMEIAFQCCGTVGPESYILPILPISCCPFLESNFICKLSDAYGGCNKVLSQYGVSYGHTIGILIVVIIVVELAAMIFSFYLYCNIDRREQNV